MLKNLPTSSSLLKHFVGMTLMLVVGCYSGEKEVFPGYVEGEFVYVASPFAGQLLEVLVGKGSQVGAHQKLFTLDSTLERAESERAEQLYYKAQSNYEDLSKGLRPSEMASLTAQLEQAKSKAELSKKNFARISKLFNSNATSQQALDDAIFARDQSAELVTQLEHEINTAKLGARADQLKAAREEVRARKQELVQAQWKLSQKEQAALEDALVFDVLFRKGEWVPAGQAVVSLLPPQNIKVRTFISERNLVNVHIGQTAEVILGEGALNIQGRVSYISAQAEYTPPVIYSRESRSKLVFMIELAFDPEVAKSLKPGQPVEVKLG